MGPQQGRSAPPGKPQANGSAAAARRNSKEGKAAVRYRECQRNHAASIGGHAVDGCREFMASTADALACAACGCHRSFHKREVDDAGAAAAECHDDDCSSVDTR